jgi:hypothetical protein
MCSCSSLPGVVRHGWLARHALRLPNQALRSLFLTRKSDANSGFLRSNELVLERDGYVAQIKTLEGRLGNQAALVALSQEISENATNDMFELTQQCSDLLTQIELRNTEIADLRFELALQRKESSSDQGSGFTAEEEGNDGQSKPPTSAIEERLRARLQLPAFPYPYGDSSRTDDDPHAVSYRKSSESEGDPDSDPSEGGSDPGDDQPNIPSQHRGGSQGMSSNFSSTRVQIHHDAREFNEWFRELRTYANNPPQTIRAPLGDQQEGEPRVAERYWISMLKSLVNSPPAAEENAAYEDNEQSSGNEDDCCKEQLVIAEAQIEQYKRQVEDLAERMGDKDDKFYV